VGFNATARGYYPPRYVYEQQIASTGAQAGRLSSLADAGRAAWIDPAQMHPKQLLAERKQLDAELRMKGRLTAQKERRHKELRLQELELRMRHALARIDRSESAAEVEDYHARLGKLHVECAQLLRDLGR